MTVTPFDSGIYGDLLGDAEIRELFSDTAQVRAMLEVEAALARAEAARGIIPKEAATAIGEAAARALDADWGAIGAATEASGVPVAALVSQLRATLEPEWREFVHWGATSQDIVDTAMVLRLRVALDVLAQRIDGLMARLRHLAAQHRQTLMVGRTRSQQATPITFGLKVVGWLAPFTRHRARLRELRTRLLCVQLGGAAGTLASFGGEGLEVATRVADELGLETPPLPWHTQRDAIAELGGWLSLVTGSLGKIGRDVLLLAQSEIDELREGGEGHGTSSTMPQKSNPVTAETLVALGRVNAGLLGSLHQASTPEHERGGPEWMMEWATLPQMVSCAAAALRHGERLFSNLEVRTDRMRQNLDRARGLPLAEAAVLELARHMPRSRALELVTEACRRVESSREDLVSVLREATPAPVDWDRLADPATATGLAVELVDGFLTRLATEDEDGAKA
ncbi:MAG TPA: 3-carboxy-cis,cis-muconate cycloisomerase [Vicinamibacteria bacterium]|jgi:3-carboxy-cis,cis-muconate cycloisomerase